MIENVRTQLVASFALLAMSTASLADCASDLNDVLAASMTSGPFRTETSISSAGTDMQMTGNIIPPDQFDINTGQGRMILTKEGAWMQQGGQWTQMPDMVRKMVGGQAAIATEQTLKNATNIKCLGEKDFEGKSYAAYEFDTTGEMMGVKATSHVVIYAEGGKPAVSIIDGEAMGQKSHTVQK